MRAVAGAALLLSTACASYAPIRPAEANRGSYVRVHLAEPAAARLSQLAGTSVRVLEGRVVSWEEGQRLVLERRRTDVQGAPLAFREVFPLYREDILQLEERHVAAGRTALLAGSAAAVIGAIIWKLATDEGSGGDDAGDGRGPTTLRVPVRILIR